MRRSEPTDRSPAAAPGTPSAAVLQAGAQVRGRIVDLAYGGAGVLRTPGGVVLVRRAFPGDEVEVRLRRRRKGVWEGELVTLVEPAPERVPPACPHLELCGGCALQGLAPAAQTRWKAHQAKELLRRIGHFEPAETAPPWSAPEPWYYRNKMEFTFAPRPWVSRAELDAGGPLPPGPALGLHPRGRYDGVFNVTDCRLQSPLSNRIVTVVRELARHRNLPAYVSRADQGLLRHLVIRQAHHTADLLVVLVVRSEHPALPAVAREIVAAVPEITSLVASVNLRRATVAQGDYEVALYGEPAWHEMLCGLRMRIEAAAFFQTQTLGAQALAEELLALGAFASRDRVLDLYCGAGSFSLPIAQRAGTVLGVELVPAAVTAATANAARNGITNARFLCAAIEAREPAAWEGESWDWVLLDPPRSGLHPRALERVVRLGAPRILYVSCNPATLARDAGRLVAEAGYRARRLRVFDLFPQTPHLESVLLLERG